MTEEESASFDNAKFEVIVSGPRVPFLFSGGSALLSKREDSEGVYYVLNRLSYRRGQWSVWAFDEKKLKKWAKAVGVTKVIAWEEDEESAFESMKRGDSRRY